jgi:putative transposase
MKQKPPSRPLDITEDVWSEAVRRERMVRSLPVSGTNSRTAVKAAAVALGLSVAQVYRLIATFRANPITGSLVVTKPGPRKGTCLLPCDVEQRIEQAINDIFTSRERPTMAKLRRDLRKDCTAAGLKQPSRTAIQERVSARSLRDMVTMNAATDVSNDVRAASLPSSVFAPALALIARAPHAACAGRASIVGCGR